MLFPSTRQVQVATCYVHVTCLKQQNINEKYSQYRITSLSCSPHLGKNTKRYTITNFNLYQVIQKQVGKVDWITFQRLSPDSDSSLSFMILALLDFFEYSGHAQVIISPYFAMATLKTIVMAMKHINLYYPFYYLYLPADTFVN